MGRLSPFRISLGLAVVFLIFITPNNAAPVQESAPSPSGSDKGCFFEQKHYLSGQTIDNNDKCLNCTCAGNALMCYLRVCPFIKPLDEHCKVEKHPEECCPKYYCLEAYPRVTTMKPDEETRGCYVNGLYLDEGARIPMDPLKPCEACYCIRNTSVCTLQTCKLDIEGCKPQFKIGSCCPSRYNCTDEAATTVPPGIMEPEEYEGCKYHGISYKNGEQVSSPDKCQQCYCMKHEVVCTVRKCEAPSPSCVPLETPEGECCPEKYDCPPGTEIPDSALVHMVTTEKDLFKRSTTEMPQTRLAADSVTSSLAEDESSEEAETPATSESETMFPTTKGVRRIDVEDAFTTIPTTLESEDFTDEVSAETDLISRPRVPKITEAPDDRFTSAPRPTFYANRTIPGEGGCFYANRTYQNREKFDPIDPCIENCTCINSGVTCDFVECIPPAAKCKQNSNPNGCCPIYVCAVPESTLSPEDTVPRVQQTITEVAPVIKQQQIIPASFESTTESAATKITDIDKPSQQTIEFLPTLATEEVSTSSEILETSVDTKQQEIVTSITTEFSVEDKSTSSTISVTKITIYDEVSPQTSTTKREEITVSDENMEADVSTLKDSEIMHENITTAFTKFTPESETSTQSVETINPSEVTTLKSETEISTEHFEISTTSSISTSTKSDTSAMTTMETVTAPQIITTVAEEKDALGKTPLNETVIDEEVRKTPSDTKPITLTEVTSPSASTESVNPFDHTMTSTFSVETESGDLKIKEFESTSVSVDEPLEIRSTAEVGSLTSEKEASTTQTTITVKVGDDDGREKTQSETVTVADSSLNVTVASTVKEDLTTTSPKEMDTNATDLKIETDKDVLFTRTTLETEFTDTTLLWQKTTVSVPHTSTIITTPFEIVESETPTAIKTESFTDEIFTSTPEGEITDKLSTKLKWTTPELSTVTSSVFPETSRTTGIFKIIDDEKTESTKIESADTQSSTVSLIKLKTDEIRTPTQTDATKDLESQTTFVFDAETSSEIDRTTFFQTTKILTPESVETLPTTISTSIKDTSGIITTPKITISETETSADTKDIDTTDGIDISKDIMSTIASTIVETETSDVLDTSTMLSHTVTQHLLTKSEEDISTKSEFTTVSETTGSSIEYTETSSTIHDKTELSMSTLAQDAETKQPTAVSDTKDITTDVSDISQTGDITKEQVFGSSLSMEISTLSQVDIKTTTPSKTDGEGTDMKFDEHTLSTLGEISLLTKESINATEITVVPSATETSKVPTDARVPSEDEDAFEPSVTEPGKIADVTQFSTTSLTSESLESEMTINTLATTFKDEETTIKPEISTIKATEIFEVIGTSDELETDSTKPSVESTDKSTLPTKSSTFKFSQTETEKSASESSTIPTVKKTYMPSTQMTSTTLHPDGTSTEDKKISPDKELTKLFTKMSTTSMTTESLITDTGSTMLTESVKVTDARDETLTSTDVTKSIDDTVSVKTTISNLPDMTTVEPKDTSSERVTVTLLEESKTPSTASDSTTDSIERDMEDFGVKDLTTRSDLSKTTEEKIPESTTLAIKRQEQDVTTISTFTSTEITEQASSTQEIDISTDHILTPVKHIPDSLILDKTVTHSTDIETSTSALSTEMDKAETTTKDIHVETFTEETNISTTFSTGNYSETSVTEEIQLTRVTEGEILKIKTSSELPEISSTDAPIVPTLGLQPSSISEEYITDTSSTDISEQSSTSVKSITPEDIQFEQTKDETSSELPSVAETSDDKLSDSTTLAVGIKEFTISRTTDTTIIPVKHISTLTLEDTSESKTDGVEITTDGKVITTSKPIAITKITEKGESEHITVVMDTDITEISTTSTLFHDKTNISFGEMPESILTSELSETTSFEDQTKTSVPEFTSEVTSDEEITKTEGLNYIFNATQTKLPLSSTSVTAETLIDDITRYQQEAESTSILSTTLKQETDRIESLESTTKQDISTPKFTTEDISKFSVVTTQDDQFILSTSSHVRDTDIDIKQINMTIEPLGSTTKSILNVTDSLEAGDIPTKLPEIETSTLLLSEKMPTLTSDDQDSDKPEITTVTEPKISLTTIEKASTDDVTMTKTTSLQTADMGTLITVGEDVSKASEISLTTEVKQTTLLLDSTPLPMSTTEKKILLISSSIADETKEPSSTDIQEDIKSETTKLFLSEQTLKAETSTESFTDSISTKYQKPTVPEIDQFSEGTKNDSFAFTEGENTTISDSSSTKPEAVTEIPEATGIEEFGITSNITISTKETGAETESLSTKQVTVASDRSTGSEAILSTLSVSESEKTTVAEISKESVSTVTITTQTQKPFTNDTSTIIDTEITTLALTTASDELSTLIGDSESQPTKLDTDLTQQSLVFTDGSKISSDTESTFVSTELPHVSISTFSIDEKNISTDSFSPTDKEVEIKTATTFVTEIPTKDSVDIKTPSSVFIPQKESSTSPDEKSVTQFSTSSQTFSETGSEISASTLSDKTKNTTEILPKVEEETTKITIDTTNTSQIEETSTLMDKEISTPIFTSVGTSEEIIIMTTTASSTLDDRLQTKVRTAITPDILQTLPSEEPTHKITENETLLATTSIPDISKTTTEKDITVSSMKDGLITESDTTEKTDKMLPTTDDFTKSTMTSKDQVTLFSTESASTSKITYGTLEGGHTVTMGFEETSEMVDDREKTDFTSSTSERTSASTAESLEIITSTVSVSTLKEGLLEETSITEDSSIFHAEEVTNTTDSLTKLEEETEVIFTSTTESVQSFDSTERETVTTHAPKVVKTETKTPEATELPMSTTVSTDTTKTDLSTDAKIDVDITSTTESKLMDETTKEREKTIETTIIQTQEPGELSTSIVTETVDASTKAESVVPIVDAEVSTPLPKESISGITTHQDAEVFFTPTANETQVITLTTLDLKETALVTERISTIKTDKFDISEITTIDFEATKEPSTSERQTTESLMHFENVTQPETKAPVTLTTIEEKDIVTDRITQTSDKRESTTRTTMEMLKVSSFIEKEETTMVTAETPHITDSDKRIKTDSFDTDTVLTTTKVPAFDGTTEMRAVEEIVGTVIDDILSTTQEKAEEGEITTETFHLEGETKSITDIGHSDTTTIETGSTQRIMTKSPEFSSTFEESTDLVTDKISDVSKEIITPDGIEKDLTTEKVLESSDSTIKFGEIEKTQETTSDVTKRVTTAVEFTDEDTVSSDILDETKPEITTVEYTTYVTGEKDISSQKIATELTERGLIPSSTEVSPEMLIKKDAKTTTQPILIETVQAETETSTLGSTFTEESTFISTEKEKSSVKDSPSTFIIPTTDVGVSDISGATVLLTKDLKSTEFSTTEQFTKMSSLEPDRITKLEPTEVSESTTKIPITIKIPIEETVTTTLMPKLTTLKTSETTTKPKVTASVTTEVSVENITEHEIQTDTTFHFESSKKLSTDELDTLEETKPTELEMDRETSVFSDEILTTLSEISKIQSTTIIPRKTTILDTGTSIPKQITEITILDGKDASLLKSTDLKTSVEAEFPKTLSDSQTTQILTTEVVPTIERSSEFPITFSSKLDSTTTIISKEESELTPEIKIYTLEADTTSASTTAEHTVITEETILSNITFAADAMVVTTSSTSVSTDADITSSIDHHSITEIASTSSSLTTIQFETSIMDSEVSQDIAPKDISMPEKLGTTPSATQTTKGDEVVNQTTPKTTATETFVRTEPIEISQETETTEDQEGSSRHIPTKVSTQFTTETPLITSESVETSFDMTTTELTDIRSWTDPDLVETSETIEGVPALKGKRTTVDIETPEVTASKITEKTYISSTTEGIKTVSIKEAETESPTSFSSPEDFETSSLTLKTTTVEKEDVTTLTSADTTQSDKFTPDKVTLATEIKPVITTKSDAIITTEKLDETTSQDSLTSVISQDEKIFTLLSQEKPTTLQPSDKSTVIADSEMTEGISSHQDDKSDGITTEVITHLSTKAPFPGSDFTDKSETTIPLLITTTEKSDAIVTDKTQTIFEDTATKIKTFTTARSTEIAISEIVTKPSDVTTDFDIFSKDIDKTDTSSQTFAPGTETDSTVKFTIQSTDKLSTTHLFTDMVREKEEATTTQFSTEVQPSIETEVTIDLHPSSDKDKEKELTIDFVTTTKEHLISTEKTSSPLSSTEMDVKFPSTTKPSSPVTKIEDLKFDSISTAKTLEQETSSEMTSTEKSSVTESTSSTATTVPSDIVTEAGISQFGLTTDSIRKDVSVTETASTDDKISTEATTLEKRDDCFVNGTLYKDAHAITTIDPCEKCHCSSGEITCFKILCKLTKEGCKPATKLSSECCPSSYECPEDVETTTGQREFTVQDITTPIPISFMFSTTPSSIASTVLITRPDETEELTKRPTETATDKELKTISDKDIQFTVAEIEFTGKTVKDEVSSTATTFDMIETQSPGTEVTRLATKISTSSEFDLSTTSFPTMDVKGVQTQSETVDETSVTKEILTSVEHDFASTFEEPKDITSTEKTIFILSAEQDTTFETNETSTVKDYTTTTSKDEIISEATKLATETPTTLHTIKSTFASTHVDRDEESSLPSESTAGTFEISTETTDTEKTKTTDDEKTKEFTSTTTTGIEILRNFTSIASSDIEETTEIRLAETTDISKVKDITSISSIASEMTKEFTSTEPTDLEKDFSSTATTGIEKTKELTLVTTKDVEMTKEFTSTVTSGIQITENFTSTASTDSEEANEFTSTETTEIVKIKESVPTETTDIEKTKDFPTTVFTDMEKTKDFTSTATADIEKTKDFPPITSTDTEETTKFTSTETADIVKIKEFTSPSSADTEKTMEFTSTATSDIEQTKESTLIEITDIEKAEVFTSTKTTDISETKDFTTIASTDIEKRKEFAPVPTSHIEKEFIGTSTTDTKTIESTSQTTISKDDSVSTIDTIVKEDSTKTSEGEDIAETTVTDGITEQITTLIPSKLPKLDDVATITIEISSKTPTTVSIDSDEVTMGAKTTKYEFSTKEITLPEITEITVKEAKSKGKEIITTDLPIKTTLLPETGPSSVSDFDAETSSQRVEFSTDKQFNETTEETELLTTLSLLSSLSSKLISLDMVTTTDKTIFTETSKGLLSTSTFKSTSEEEITERSLGHTITMDSDETFDKIQTKTSATPLISTTSSETGMTTDYEIVTEIFEQNKSITSLDREGTVISMEKDSSTTSEAILVDTTSLATTESRHEENETTLFTGVTDKIFTFVSTRFTDLMKGITELTTAKPDNETESSLFDDTTATPILGFSTKKTDESITPLIPLTRRIDMDLETDTTKEGSSQKLETTQSTVPESSTQKIVTKLMAEETSKIQFESEETSRIDVTTEGKITSDNILTTIVSIMTSPKPETIVRTTESDKETVTTAEPTKQIFDTSLPVRTEDIPTSTSTHEPQDDSSTVKFTTSSFKTTSSVVDKETSITVSETSISEAAETTLPTLSPEPISDIMLDNISSTQEEPSKTTQEFRTDTTTQHSTVTSTTEDRKTISDTSLSETTVESTKSPLTTSETKELPEITKIVSESSVTTAATEKRKEVTFSDTDKPSRATRKDMGFETTPASFTRIDMGSTVEEIKKEDQSTPHIPHEINVTLSTSLHEDTTTFLESESTTKKMEFPPSSLDIANVTGKHTTAEESENDTSTTLEVRTDSVTSSEVATKLTKDIPVGTTISSEKTAAFEGEQESTTMTRVESVVDVTHDITTSSVYKEASDATELIKTTPHSTAFSTVTEKELPTSGTSLTKIEVVSKDLGTQETTSEPLGTTIVLHGETMTTFTEQSTASVITDTFSPTMLVTEKGTTVKDLGTQEMTSEPISSTVTQLAETMTASSTEKSTVSLATDASSTSIIVTENVTVVEDLSTQKITSESISSTVTQLSETMTAFSTEKSTVSIATDASSTSILTTENGTVVEDLETQTTFEPINTTVVLHSEITTTSSTEKSTVSVTTDRPSSPTPVTREEAKDNATELITKGPKVIETTPIPYTTTTHLSVKDSETTMAEEDYIVDENTCISKGRLFQSAEQIPRDDPCEFCFCFRGDIICLQQSCPPPARDCNETRIFGFCCPRYECPVYLTSKNMTLFNRRKGAQHVFIQQKRIDKREIRPTIEVKGCQVNGTFYELGKTVTSASGPCLHCVCQEDGLMHCDPQRCKPQAPLMLKMNNSFFKRR